MSQALTVVKNDQEDEETCKVELKRAKGKRLLKSKSAVTFDKSSDDEDVSESNLSDSLSQKQNEFNAHFDNQIGQDLAMLTRLQKGRSFGKEKTKRSRSMPVDDSESVDLDALSEEKKNLQDSRTTSS